MRFRDWLESVSSYAMGTPEAMEFLGLSPDHTPEQLEDAYRSKAMEVHPDRGGDPVEFKKVQAAYERLKAGGREPEQRQPFPDERGGYNREMARQMAPTGQYTLGDFEEWIDLIVERGYFQVKSRTPVSHVSWGMRLTKDAITMPLGSVARTFRVTGYARKGSKMQRAPRDLVMELFAPHMSRIPEFIVDMKVNDRWKEAWITMETPKGRYQSVSFTPVVKKEKRAEGVGMKREQVEEYLRSSGLRLSGSYAAGANYGVGDDHIGYFVQLGPKVVRVIKRYRTDYYGRKKIETSNRASEHYGKLTKEVLDKYVAFVKKQSQHQDDR